MSVLAILAEIMIMHHYIGDALEMTDNVIRWGKGYQSMDDKMGTIKFV
jgi:hypothetical protein